MMQQEEQATPLHRPGLWTRLRRRARVLAREQQTDRFPESDRPPVQLLLFVWGSLPMLGSKLRSLATGDRRVRRHLSGAAAFLDRHRIHPAVYTVLAVAILTAARYFSIYTTGATVTYDGEVLGCLSDEGQVKKIRASLERSASETLGRPVTISDERFQYTVGTLKRAQLSDPAQVQSALSDRLGLVSAAHSLYVNGERLGATPYAGAMEELLRQIQSSATDENTVSCSFKENVEIRDEYVPTEELVNLGYIAETLYSTKEEEVTYEVKRGDTWSEIAEDHGLTSQELLALNPGYNIDLINVGEVLTLSQAVPYLTLTVVERERYLEQVPFAIEYTDSAELWKGDYKVVSPGEYGAADVVATATYVNGVETERRILSSVTLKQPVTEHRLQGTRERPTWTPTGSFRWPTTGRISSTFGGRSSPGGIGSTNHKGIDIAVPTGTPIYAADGGTVAYAGWMSGYGYLVMINHNDGYQTRYAHNSALLVSEGQHVYKGQQIARAGSTGNSTGPHCHFEVRIDGVAKNPLNYLP